ncbi:Rieske (2Fe-2S) protein [Peterkaempfera griseoplana]|uniref:Rieske (2Fe-2S) protein n=1 Tax=Peterkaempfera griseoplana TaxID=66896 RepID=UPI0006E46C87|nr:Rieske (2Fe-2S) protein [Peterkaempfera griseoplana]
MHHLEGRPTPAADGPSRRTVLRGAAAAGAVGAGALGLSACGAGGGPSRTAPGGPVDLGPASDVPVGGGTVHRDQRIVVTQPAKGEFKAFSAVCTHAGCVVDGVVGDLIECPCHGSRFRIADGSVAAGPAPTALPAVQVTLRDGRLIAGA